jgi:predicted DNA-binding transcriptional regulator YafY
MMLQDMGIPVEATHGRHGGYRLRPGFKLPPLLFTEDEALAVTLGLLAARRIGLTGAAPATEGALAKIQRVLPVGVAERMSSLQEAISFTQRASTPAPAASEILLTLSFAFQYQRRVGVRYRDANGVETNRRFDPYGLVFHYGRWYLVGLDHRSGELRTFRVDRIQATEETDETFERPRDFDAAQHLAQTLASLPWGLEIEVLLHTTLAEAQARLAPYTATLRETEDGVMLRTQVDDLSMAAHYIVGLGVPFTVVRPPELRDEVRQIATQLLEWSA